MSAHDAPDGTALQPRITTFEEAEEIRPFGTPARIMLRTEETGGAFSALLVMHGPGEGHHRTAMQDRPNIFLSSRAPMK